MSGFILGGPLGPYFELFQKSYARIAFYIIFVRNNRDGGKRKNSISD